MYVVGNLPGSISAQCGFPVWVISETGREVKLVDLDGRRHRVGNSNQLGAHDLTRVGADDLDGAGAFDVTFEHSLQILRGLKRLGRIFSPVSL